MDPDSSETRLQYGLRQTLPSASLEGSSVAPHPVEHDRQLTGDSHRGFLISDTLGKVFQYLYNPPMKAAAAAGARSFAPSMK